MPCTPPLLTPPFLVVLIKQVTQLLNQFTIEFGPKSAQLLDAILLPYVRRTYELIPGAGSASAASGVAGADAHGNGTGTGPQQALGEGPGPGSGGGVWGGLGGIIDAGSRGRTEGVNNNGMGTAGTSLSGESRGGRSSAIAGGNLLAHEVAERSAIQKLYLSVIQHVCSNGLAGVLSSPTNGSHLDTILRSILAGLAGLDDAVTKKTCLYIFALLLQGFNRGRSGGRELHAPTLPAAANGGSAGVTTATAAAGCVKSTKPAGSHRRSPSGKGGSLWMGTEPTVDMEPSVRVAVTSFVLKEAIPAAIACLVDNGPAGLDLRDAMTVSAMTQMGALMMQAKVANGGSAAFVRAAAVACSCTSQVREMLLYRGRSGQRK